MRSDSFSSRIDTPLTSPSQTSHTNSPKKKFPKFKLLNINFQSVRNKIPEFHTKLYIEQPDIVAGTESWLIPDILDSEIVPTNLEYAMFREDRTSNTGGGVFILVKNDIIATKQEKFQTDCEIVWIKIELVGTKPLYIAAYYRLKENDVYNADGFRKSLEMVSQQKGDIWVLSDLNYPKLNWDKNDVLFTKPGSAHPTLYDSFIETMLEYNLTQMVRDPTRLGNILDLYLTTNHTLVDTVNVIPGLSDHDIIKCVVDTKPNLAKTSPRKTYLYRKADWDSLRAYLKDFCNSFVLSYEGKSVESLWLEFKEALNCGIQKFIPSKFVGKIHLPWTTQSVKRNQEKGIGCTKNLRDQKILGTEEPF